MGFGAKIRSLQPQFAKMGNRPILKSFCLLAVGNFRKQSCMNLWLNTRNKNPGSSFSHTRGFPTKREKMVFYGENTTFSGSICSDGSSANLGNILGVDLH